MAWPLTFNITTNFVGRAGSLPVLLPFGTEGLFPGVIVKSMRSTPMIEEIEVPNGTGLNVSNILLNQGDMVEFSFDDDRSITWPMTGGVVTLFNPQPNGSGATSELFQVINNNYNQAAKAVGERTIIAKRYSLIVPTPM